MPASAFEPLTFAHGPSMANRFMLAPMTNLQSHPDGTLGDDEYRWLTMRAAGGFGLTMTCAAHVQAGGQGFPGQLGVFGDQHLDGLKRLAAGIQEHPSLAVVQLYHGGKRAPQKITGEVPVSSSADAKTGARALELGEVEALRDAFIEAAVRCEKAGFDGVEVHGAHGYIITQFLSPRMNQRADRYGGDLEGRARLLFEILEGIRARCRPDFNLGLRLSVERFGMVLSEGVALTQRVLASGLVDYLDLSLWDVFKEPAEEAHQGEGRTLLSHFTGLERGQTRLGVAGKIYSGADVQACLDAGVDFVSLGRAAILHHDFPKRMAEDPSFEVAALPVSPDYLREQGLGPAFVQYMSGWEGFVAPTSAG